MGVRFACHHCGKRLNIKYELAGKRGICPGCSARFRIPLADAEQSIPLSDAELSPARRSAAGRSAGGQNGVEIAAAGRPSSERAKPPAQRASQPAERPGLHVKRAEPPARRGGGQAHRTGQPNSSTSSSESVATVDWLTGDVSATWYVRPPSGGQYGPASSEVLRQWIDEGRLAATSLVWRDGWPQWRVAREAFPDLAGRLPSGSGFADGSSAPIGTEAQSGPTSHSPDETSPPAQPALRGQGDVGAERHRRSSRRTMVIGILFAVTLALFGSLWAIVTL